MQGSRVSISSGMSVWEGSGSGWSFDAPASVWSSACHGHQRPPVCSTSRVNLDTGKSLF